MLIVNFKMVPKNFKNFRYMYTRGLKNRFQSTSMNQVWINFFCPSQKVGFRTQNLPSLLLLSTNITLSTLLILAYAGRVSYELFNTTLPVLHASMRGRQVSQITTVVDLKCYTPGVTNRIFGSRTQSNFIELDHGLSSIDSVIEHNWKRKWNLL